MTRLAGTVDGVIGVDTHRDSLAAAVTDSVGGLLAQTSVSADGVGYQRLLAFAQAQVPGRRCWAVERRKLRRRAHRPAASLRGAGGRGWPAQAVGAARRREERCAGRRPGGPGGARLRPSARTAPPRGSGSAAGAVGHPAERLHREGRRHEPAQGADRRRARGVARRASRAGDQAADSAVRRAAGPASTVAGAPHDRPGAALHSTASSCWPPRLPSCGPSWTGWSPLSRHGCWSCPASDRSAPPRS